MITRIDVLVVASLNMDHVVSVRELPAPGETVLASGRHLVLGGKGGNQAVAAARLGSRTAVVGGVGADEAGEQYVAGLAAESIDTSGVTVWGDDHTGIAIVSVDDSGANSIVVVPGANDRISPEQALAAVRGSSPRVVVAQLETPAAASAAAFAEGRVQGAITILNPAPAAPLPDALLEVTDILVPNEVEFAQLTGRTSGTDDDLLAGSRQFLAKGVAAVVVTLGERGCAIVHDGVVRRMAAHRVQAVDTTAAGDSFIGALAHEIGRSGSIDEASIERGCRTAIAVGALTVQRRGAQSSLPYAHELVESP